MAVVKSVVVIITLSFLVSPPLKPLFHPRHHGEQNGAGRPAGLTPVTLPTIVHCLLLAATTTGLSDPNGTSAPDVGDSMRGFEPEGLRGSGLIHVELKISATLSWFHRIRCGASYRRFSSISGLV